MTGSGVIDVIIGLILMYLVLSLICSGVNEWVAAALKKRARFLEEGVRNLFAGDSEMTKGFFDLPLIQGLMRDKGGAKQKPSYIGSSTFALAVLDKWVPSALESGAAIADVRRDILAIPIPEVRDTFLTFLKDAQDDLIKFRRHVEGWYDSTMDRVSGWYRRYTKIALLVIGVIVASVLNADTIRLANTLWASPTVRAALVAQAQQVARQGSTPVGSQSLSQDVQAAKTLPLPLGWSTDTKNRNDPRRVPANVVQWLIKALGLLITGAALSLGAPFWFNALGKALGLRSSGPTPKKPANLDETAPEHT